MKRHKVNTSILSGKIACFAVSLYVVRRPRRLFFRLNHWRIVRKRCSHSTFSSQATRPSKSVNSGIVPLQQIRRNLRVAVWVLNTINSNKRIEIYFPLRYLLFKLLRWEPPNLIASCEFKQFWFTNWAQLSTHLWKTCLQRILHASRNCRKFVYYSWAIRVNHAAEHLSCVVILNPFQESYLLWRANNLFRESRNESW